MDVTSYLLGKNASGGGGGGSDIFNDTIIGNDDDPTYAYNLAWTKAIKNYIVPPIEGTSAYNMFAYTPNINFDFSHAGGSNVTDMRSMFENCLAENIDLSPIHNSVVTNTSFMFNGTLLTLKHVDMRNFDFSNITSYNIMFPTGMYGGDNNVEIIVADQTQKEWLTSRMSYLKNVKTVAEYEAGN